MEKIPVYQPSLSGREKEYVLDCLDSTWISSKGSYINRFEQSFAEKIRVKHATSVSNGTVALHLALVALGIGPEDEVIVPTLTYIASVNAIAYTGAKPVFVDSLRTTWQIDPDDIRKKITKKTRAIMVVHLYGHPCDMDAIMKIAEEYGLFVVEDCAEAFGSLYKGRPVGGIGHISTFSFFGNKTITTGEGGMVATNDQTLFERAVHFKGQGLATHRQYWHDVIGYNYRMTNICAAIGLAQLEQADEFLKQKRRVANRYREELVGCPLDIQGEYGDVYNSYWMVSILVDNATKRDALMQHLDRNGIETRPLFYPVHTMPMYSEKFQRHPVAEDLGWRGVNLPSWPGLSDSDIVRISAVIKDFL
ncbi:MAG: DegT/DnrJ/EryC1/StrS aminotransferase family protein [Burkholderiales bacterium]|nr:DegT/DnrJ/EryC1/StrS aminotransferase family protein [Burkholderiales bacterium]